MKIVDTIFGPFDAALAKKFKAAFKEAQGKHEQFNFTIADGREALILTSLAKYLVEFFENEGLLKKS